MPTSSSDRQLTWKFCPESRRRNSSTSLREMSAKLTSFTPLPLATGTARLPRTGNSEPRRYRLRRIARRCDVRWTVDPDTYQVRGLPLRATASSVRSRTFSNGRSRTLTVTGDSLVTPVISRPVQSARIARPESLVYWASTRISGTLTKLTRGILRASLPLTVAGRRSAAAAATTIAAATAPTAAISINLRVRIVHLRGQQLRIAVVPARRRSNGMMPAAPTWAMHLL